MTQGQQKKLKSAYERFASEIAALASTNTAAAAQAKTLRADRETFVSEQGTIRSSR